MTFILKPQVRPKQGKGRASIGDTVVVTEAAPGAWGKTGAEADREECLTGSFIVKKTFTAERINRAPLERAFIISTEGRILSLSGTEKRRRKRKGERFLAGARNDNQVVVAM